MEESNYIEKLYEKLDTVDDPEFKKLVVKLIEERNYLTNAASIDPLSGLYNRRVLENIRNYELVSMIDVDNFKTINDSFGHDVGDRVIRIVSSIIKNNSRGNDYVIRYGGDEFLVVFTGGDLKTIKERMEKIRKEVSEQIKLPNFNLTLSIGVSPYEPGCTLEDSIKKADEIMYYSKTSGKDKISTYEEISDKTR